jgi:hypothetical protein
MRAEHLNTKDCLQVSEPDRLDQFIAVLDALYARREVLTARLDYLTEATKLAEARSPGQQEDIENQRSEYRRIEERIAVLKERLESGRTAAD